MALAAYENLIMDMEIPAGGYLGPDVKVTFHKLGRTERNLNFKWGVEATLHLRQYEEFTLTGRELKTLTPDEMVGLLRTTLQAMLDQMKKKIDPVRDAWYFEETPPPLPSEPPLLEQGS